MKSTRPAALNGAIEPAPSRRQTALKWVGKIAAMGGLPGVILTPIVSAYFSPKVAKFLSHQHRIHGIWTEWQPPLASCTVWNVTLIPKQSITHLDIFFHFDQEYHDVLIRRVRPDFSGQNSRLIPEDVAMKEPCDFDEPSALNSDKFNVIRYNDRNGITVKGSDLQPDDTYMVAVSFHPDFIIGSTGWGGKTIAATYTAYGQELPALLDITNRPPRFGPMPDDDLPKIPSEFDKQ